MAQAPGDQNQPSLSISRVLRHNYTLSYTLLRGGLSAYPLRPFLRNFPRHNEEKNSSRVKLRMNGTVYLSFEERRLEMTTA